MHDGHASGGPRHPARQLTAASGLLLLLALAACDEGMAPATANANGSPPPISHGPVVVTIASAGDSVVGGDPLRFRVSANPAPPAALTVTVTITAPDCELAQSPESVTIAAGESHATLTVPSSGVAAGANRCVVTATIAAGEGYEVGEAAGASASATLTMQPVVTVTRDSASVTEGEQVSFTLTAAPPPAVDLTVTVSWSDPGSFLAASVPRMVTIPASESTAALTAATVDGAGEPDGSVTATVEAGSGYTVGASGSATVAVTATTSPSPAPRPAPRPPLPAVSIDSGVTEGEVTEGEDMVFELTAYPARLPGPDLTINLKWGGSGRHLAPNLPDTVTVPRTSDPNAGGVATAVDVDGTALHRFSVATVDDSKRDGAVFVIVEVLDGIGYEVSFVSPGAAITILDND